jgi:hypothetical protein
MSDLRIDLIINDLKSIVKRLKTYNDASNDAKNYKNHLLSWFQSNYITTNNSKDRIKFKEIFSKYKNDEHPKKYRIQKYSEFISEFNLNVMKLDQDHNKAYIIKGIKVKVL